MSARASVPVPAAVAALLPQTFLAGLPRQVVTELLEGGRLVEVRAGGNLGPSRSPVESPGVALVVDGLVRAFLRSNRERQVTVRYARPGEALGLVQLLGGRLDVHAQAVTDTTVFTLRRRRLLELAGESAPLGVAIARECAARVSDAVEELSLLTFGSVRQRLARHLLNLASGDAGGDQLVARVTQQSLADASGSVREVVARELKALQSAGRIGRSSAGVVILDAAGLDAEARGAG